MIIERVWAMPNKNTFEIKPIRELITSEKTEGLWIDPFANRNKIAEITNDLNPEFETDYHMDALDFLKMFPDQSVDGVLYDPPYSPRQVSECYNDVGYNVTWDTTKASFWGNHKKEISRILKTGGKVITFGWNSGGIGKNNGFSITRILLVPHGGWHNDTICTVEVKIGEINEHKMTNQLNLFEENAIIENAHLNETDIKIMKDLQDLPDDFWDFRGESTKDLTHGLHTYPAVMVYPISRKLIDIVRKYKDIDSILDPFVGSGTVLVEGMLSGIKEIYGNDLNPLARLITSVKTTPIERELLLSNVTLFKIGLNNFYAEYSDSIHDVNDYVSIRLGLDVSDKNGWATDASEILNNYLSNKNLKLQVPNFKNMGYWFTPRAILELQLIKECIQDIENEDIKNFIWIAYSEIIRLVSNRRNGEFKMFRMPHDKVRTFNPNVLAEFNKQLDKNIEKMIAFSDLCVSQNINAKKVILNEDSRILQTISDNTIDLMITSPPYGDSKTTVAYGEFSKLSLQWIDLYEVSEQDIAKIDRSLMGGTKFLNGFEFKLDSKILERSLEKIFKVDIERAGDVYSFYNDLDECLKSITLKMKKDSYQFWVVGNRTVKLEYLQTDRILVELSKKYGLVHLTTVKRRIPNKVMPSQNSPSNVVGEKVTTMNDEYIVVLRKI